MSLGPFRHRAGPGDGLPAVAGAAERAAAALARRLAAGRAPLGKEDLARLGGGGAGVPGGGGRAALETDAALAEPSAGPPLLYFPALPWAFRFQRPQQLALALARTAGGPAVLYLEAFARQRLQPAQRLVLDTARLQVLRLRVPGRPDAFRQAMPAAAVPALAAAVVAGLAHLPGRPPAILVQLPFWAPLGEELRRRLGAPLVYDRIDLHTAFPGVPPEVGEREKALIAAADLVTASSPDLAELPRSLGTRTELLPNAAAVEDFEDARPRPTAGGGPEGAGTGVVAGFVGALDGRIDAAALEAAARELPGWEFRLAGRIEDPRVGALGRLPNVELLGEIPYPRVPGFLAGLDVGLAPYRDLPATRAVDPVKLYEMLAVGLPVAVRRLPAVERWRPPLVYPYDDPGSLAITLVAARREDREELRHRRREAAAAESWPRRAAALLAAIAALG